MNSEERILNLMQFARKAGKLVLGHDATIRAINHKLVYLVITAGDTAPRTIRSMEMVLGSMDKPVSSIRFGKQSEFGRALGIPDTAVLGVLDRNFAAKMLQYWSAKD